MRNLPGSSLPQVKNIVFLMFENRSLDNLLGWLYDESLPPKEFVGSGPRLYDGLAAGKYWNPALDGEQVYVQPVPDKVWGAGEAVPWHDPWEAMVKTYKDDLRPSLGKWHGVMNQLFGDRSMITGLPSSASGEPTMKGFLQDYYAFYEFEWKGHDILWTYTPQQLQVINGLAREFAVSDRWFCSVPSETNPNRAYSLCGTSLGRESNQNTFAFEQFDTRTVFNYLAAARKSWAIYFHDHWTSSACYTQHTFPQIADAQGESEISDISKFFQRAKEGSLPDFTYLEPCWQGLKQGNDYHPPGHVQPAEAFLQAVYQAIRTGPQWPETLLIITFDEHGGTYDHVAPPWGAINPDGIKGIENGFGFDLFGVRVPTILVSPFIKPGTVFRAPAGSRYPFEHTSFIKTLLLWAGVDLSSVQLGKRMPEAPTFDGVLAADHVNSAEVEFAPLEEPPTTNCGKSAAHPAGSAEQLQNLLTGIPVVATRAILRRNNTLDAIQTDVERYLRDPEAFEASLKS